MKLTCCTWLAASVLLVACGPSEKQKAQFAEEKRVHCLDNWCEGDVAPAHDTSKEFAFKLNGQWFIGPRAYGGYGGSLAFLWPSKTPARKANASKEAPEFIPSSAGIVSNFYEVGIEIFMRTHDGVMPGPNGYERLKQAEAEGRLVSKEQLRPGLEVWRVRKESGLPGVWYVAINLNDRGAGAPVLWCSEQDVKTDFCTMAFIWRPGIAVDMRFHAKHGPDWPEIHQEMLRVLQLLRKA